MDKPHGWDELPAGVTRRVRVNKSFLKDGSLEDRYIVHEGDVEIMYYGLMSPDGFKMVSGPAKPEGSYCDGPQIAWVETDGVLWVTK